MSKTTIAAVCIAMSTLLLAVGKVLQGEAPDFSEIMTAVSALAAAFGLWKAKDAASR